MTDIDKDIRTLRLRVAELERERDVLKARLGQMLSPAYSPPPVGRWQFFDGKE